MTQEFDNTNRGALFNNKRKTSDNHPDMTGKINIDGTEYWLSGWYKEMKGSGDEYMSLSLGDEVEAREEVAATKPAPVKRRGTPAKKR